MAGHLDEKHLVSQTYVRLTQRYTQVPPEIVEAIVRTVHGSMTGPIRDFVPLLVEREAAERLREYAALLVPLGASTAGPGAGHRWRADPTLPA
ncbi:MAG: hypothetical protein IPI32_09120 [Austwickia sp.]|jgi:hypothetical protein|nr:hypothetical protein [Austwickia sp.]MBK8436343.1 hypothetical protein [Austwickia sp.]MBK9102020.1 hypothetical protein [Austwickia sp.]